MSRTFKDMRHLFSFTKVDEISCLVYDIAHNRSNYGLRIRPHSSVENHLEI